MDRPQFVYVIYISTTPEKLWNALMDGEMTKPYGGRHRNVSDWKIGSMWKHQDYDDAGLFDIVGEVVESTPPRRLLLTWAFPANDCLDWLQRFKTLSRCSPQFARRLDNR